MKLRHTLVLLLFFATQAGAADRFTGPWNLKELKKVPLASFHSPTGNLNDLTQVFYENVPLGGKQTRVFGYLATPKTGKAPYPAMVLVHGGGGQAFKEWAQLWADRGYVALAMDLSGRGPDQKRLPDGGPEQSDDSKFRDFAPNEADQMWSYHAVAAVIRAHSLLASLRNVDRDRIGVTGISWGGYLTCIVAGIDDRLKVAVPVYGCGFLQQNSYWLEPRFKKMGEAKTKQWVDLFDPSKYLPGVSVPILFMNGTNDFAYPMDSYQKSYGLVRPEFVDLCVTVKMPHGHGVGWAPKEIGLFVDSVIGKAKKPIRLSMPTIDNGTWKTEITNDHIGSKGKFHFTTDTGPWPTRNWTSVDAAIDGKVISAAPKIDKAADGFFTVQDDRGAVSSSPYLHAAK